MPGRVLALLAPGLSRMAKRCILSLCCIWLRHSQASTLVVHKMHRPSVMRVFCHISPSFARWPGREAPRLAAQENWTEYPVEREHAPMYAVRVIEYSSRSDDPGRGNLLAHMYGVFCRFLRPGLTYPQTYCGVAKTVLVRRVQIKPSQLWQGGRIE